MSTSSNTDASIGSKRDSSHLAIIAAEELIESGWTDIDSTTAALSKDAVEGLKELSLETTALEELIDAKLNQSITNLKEEVVKCNTLISNLQAAIDIQTKDQKLQWAISNTSINDFQYYDKNSLVPLFTSPGLDGRVSSSKLVKLTLLKFRKGDGMHITNRSMTSYEKHSDEKGIEDGEKRFRNMLRNQIHELLGHKPRISLTDKGYAIYYS